MPWQHKFNEIDGVSIPDAKLLKRPSFDWRVLVNDDNYKIFCDVFAEMIGDIIRFEGQGGL